MNEVIKQQSDEMYSISLDSSSDEEYAFIVQSQVIKEMDKDSQSGLPKTTVIIGATEVRMLIDSGASVNIIDKTTYRTLLQEMPSIKLEHTNIKLK